MRPILLSSVFPGAGRSARGPFEAALAAKDVSGLWPGVYLAEEVATRVGAGEVLQRALPAAGEKNFMLTRRGPSTAAGPVGNTPVPREPRLLPDARSGAGRSALEDLGELVFGTEWKIQLRCLANTSAGTAAESPAISHKQRLRSRGNHGRVIRLRPNIRGLERRGLAGRYSCLPAQGPSTLAATT